MRLSMWLFLHQTWIFLEWDWCFWPVVLVKIPRPLDCKESNQSILKKINPEYSLEGLMLKLKFQYLGNLIWRADSLEKTDAGKDWRQKKKGTTEDEKVRWHHWLNGHEFEQTLGDGEGQGSLVCCSPWGHKGSDMTEQLNNKATTQLTASLGKSHNRIFTRRDRIRTRHVNG